jgi:putative glutamine amidotransferase
MIEQRGEHTRLLTHRFKGNVAGIIEGVNGIMFTGGEGIHPSFYGQEIDPSAVGTTKLARDEFELALLREALHRDLPVLGICRGMQLINVGFGGPLLQGIKGHDLIPTERHSIFISPGSKLGAIVGAGVHHRTNSYHHQGLKDPQKAADLLASAYSIEDGVIEGLESPLHSWVIGVQCHPERPEEVPRSFGNLFSNFVDWSQRSN